MQRTKEISKVSRQLCAGAQLISLAASLSFCGAGRAADWASRPPPFAAGEPWQRHGVPCSVGAPVWAPPLATAEDLPWPSVWLGHFSGGRPYAGATGQTLVDWRDEKLCFSSRRACQVWIARLRRAYHRPEGYWACLVQR